MTLKSLRIAQKKKTMRELFYEAEREFRKLKPSIGFTSINVFNGWEHYIEHWFLKRLDTEVTNQGDFVQVKDIKYKLNELRVSYNSILGVDYDDFIENYTQINEQT